MNEKKLAEYKRKYDIARHHAWAGSVILAIFLALRFFLETTDVIIDNWIILLIGIIVIIYTLTAVIFTYRYRSGLTSQQKIIEVHTSSEIEKEPLKAKAEKEKMKIEKKKAKAKLKAEKKKNNL